MIKDGTQLFNPLRRAAEFDQAVELATGKATPASERQPSFGEESDGSWVKRVLRFLNSGVQSFGGVVVVNRDRLLCDDRAGIDALVHQVHGASGHFDAVIERLLPGFQAGKSRQKSWVDVHDALIKGAKELAFQNAHESRQHHEIDLRFLQGGDISPFRVVVKFGAELPRGYMPGRYAKRLRPGKDSRVRDIADDHGDLER